MRLRSCFCLLVAAWRDHPGLRSGYQFAVIAQNSNASGTKVTLADRTSETIRTSRHSQCNTKLSSATAFVGNWRAAARRRLRREVQPHLVGIVKEYLFVFERLGALGATHRSTGCWLGVLG